MIAELVESAIGAACARSLFDHYESCEMPLFICPPEHAVKWLLFVLRLRT